MRQSRVNTKATVIATERCIAEYVSGLSADGRSRRRQRRAGRPEAEASPGLSDRNSAALDEESETGHIVIFDVYKT
jgi:hypothetical protein